ncbi:MAG: DoxX family protein [Acidimicrobiia bacterium]|nr:DoxX family protein [Acidimicrobiia bacterium]MDH4309085.1 DoxX family protein [Acidimicrobiia bacterium]
MDVILIIGRVLYALIFLGSGIGGHFMQTAGTAGYAQSRGLKNAESLVRISGVGLVAIAIGIALGVWIDVAALGAIAYLLITNVLIHHFWSDSDMLQQLEMTNFMKNLSMVGGALVIFALADQMGPMLTDPLF